MITAQDVITSRKEVNSKLIMFGVFNRTYNRWSYLDLKYLVPSDSFDIKNNLIINDALTNLSKDEYHVLVEDLTAEDPEINETVQLRVFYIAKW